MTSVVRSMALTSAYYDICANEYRSLADGHDSDRLIGGFLEGLAPRSTVLDVGCGSGRDLGYIRECGHVGVGIDRSKQLTRIARNSGLQRLAAADMVELPIRDECVDAAIGIAVIHHLPEEVQLLAISEMSRVLRAGGWLLLTAKLSVEVFWDSHPDLGCSRAFFPVSEPIISAFGAAAGLSLIAEDLDSDSRGRGTQWVRFTLLKSA